MPHPIVNQTRPSVEFAVPIPSLLAGVQRGSIPGAPNALLFPRKCATSVSSLLTVYNQLADTALKRSQQFRSRAGDLDHVAMTNASIAFEIDSGFDVEHHACFHRFRGLGMKAWFRLRANRGKSYAVSRGMLELRSESPGLENIPRRGIDIRRFCSRMNRAQRGIARGKYRVVHPLPAFIRLAYGVRASDVGPVPVGIGVQVHQHQISRFDPLRPRSGVGP